MKKNKIIKYSIIFLTFIFLCFVVYYISYLNNYKKVVESIDILAKQYDIEQEYLADYDSNLYTLENPKVILNPYDISPLTALILFETDNVEKVTITIKGKDEKTTIKHTFEEGSNHILPIYGLYPDYENTIIITAGNATKEIKIKTETFPDDIVLPTKIYAEKDKINNDLIFLSPAAKGYVVAYDMNGDVRWYLTENFSWDIKKLKNGHLLLGSYRLVNSPYYTIGFDEMDFTGKIYNEYVLPGGYHHDVFEMENGDFLIASNDFSKGTVEDNVVLMDRTTGEIKKTWNIDNIIPTDESKSENWIEHDWFHNNAVWYDKNTNSITLSGRHLDIVINIDFDSGKLNWILGDNTNWDEDMQKYFFTPVGDNFEWQWSQHAAMVLPNGNIFLFDNGNNRSKNESEYIDANDNYSRGVIYNIDTENMIIRQLWEYGKERRSEFYSPYISDVDYYSDEHYLVHSGGIGSLDGNALNQPGVLYESAKLNSITTEILNDKVVFELDLPSNFYRAEKMSLYSDNNLEFGLGKRIGSLDETSTCGKKTNILFASKIIPEEYNISFKKDSDRLVFNGTFIKNTEVYIILNSLFEQKVYQVVVSQTPYTAMCIGIFNTDANDEKLNINYYVNEENLSGNYNIFLKIGKKIYNTGEFVHFE